MVNQAGKYLTFLLNDEEYAISIKRVREIIGMQQITQIPKTPEFIKGVINLRGKIIPVIDLRRKFGLMPQEYNERTCIIVVEVLFGEIPRQIGVVVDLVSEVISLQPDDIEPPPQYCTQIDVSFITGIGKLKERVVIILNIEELLSREELTLIKEIKGGHEG